MGTRKHSPGAVLARLAGGRDDIFEEVQGSRTRFVTMGGVLLSTAAMAFVSAAFAVHMAVGASLLVALLIGAAWATVILNLDRMLIVGMGHERSVGRNLGMAVPRLVLALILGTVISTPLTLQIFHKEIEAQLAVLHQQAADDYKRRLAADPDLRRIPELEQKVAKEKATVTGGGTVDPSKDPRVVAAGSDVAAKQAVYDRESTAHAKLATRAQCELDGTCGTGVAGTGTAYREAKATAERQLAVAQAAQRDLDTSKRALATAQGQASSSAAGSTVRTVDQAQKDLATDQAAVADLDAKKTRLQNEFDALTRSDNGLLARLEALDSLGTQRPILRWAQLLVAALFVCVEILPVLMKFLLNVGKPNAYDRVLDQRDNADADLYDIALAGRRTLAQQRADADVATDSDRLARQQKATLQVNKEVVRQQTEIVRKALAIWGAHAQRRAEKQLEDYEDSLAGGSPGTGAPPPVVGSGGYFIPPPPTPAQGPARVNGNRANGFVHAAQMPDLDDI